MVERLQLTPDLVSSLEPPPEGERWIADTRQKGFGLRLWSTKSGGQKAYAIRASNNSGKSVRLTYDPSDRWWWATARIDCSSALDEEELYAAAVEDAREWASETIKRLKRPQDYEESDESRANYARVAQVVDNLSLKRACKSVLMGFGISGVSQSYRDRLEQAFLYLPTELQDQTLESADLETLLTFARNANLPKSTRSDLETILRKIYCEALHFSRELWPKHSFISHPHMNRSIVRRIPDSEPWLGEEMPDKFLHFLLNEKIYWQQALCIAATFETYLPISVIKRSRWTQVDDDSEMWWPYLPQERRYWYFRGYQLRGALQEIFQLLRSHSQTTGGKGAFLFPSPINADAPICSTEKIRKALVREFRLPDVSVKRLADQCREIRLRNFIFEW